MTAQEIGAILQQYPWTVHGLLPHSEIERAFAMHRAGLEDLYRSAGARGMKLPRTEVDRTFQWRGITFTLLASKPVGVCMRKRLYARCPDCGRDFECGHFFMHAKVHK